MWYPRTLLSGRLTWVLLQRSRGRSSFLPWYVSLSVWLLACICNLPVSTTFFRGPSSDGECGRLPGGATSSPRKQQNPPEVWLELSVGVVELMMHSQISSLRNPTPSCIYLEIDIYVFRHERGSFLSHLGKGDLKSSERALQQAFANLLGVKVCSV